MIFKHSEYLGDKDLGEAVEAPGTVRSLSQVFWGGVGARVGKRILLLGEGGGGLEVVLWSLEANIGGRGDKDRLL